MHRRGKRPGRLGLRIILVAMAVAAPAARAAPVRRLAIIVGVNDGGPSRTTLRYAQRDARMIASVLAELGGVAHDDLVVLDDASREAMEQALAAVRPRLERARRAGERVELFFYYSGHSDETGLLLGASRLRYARLRRLIEGLPADVRIAVLDSCASGAMTRGKGGLRGPPFMVDLSTDVQGHAFVASAAETEVAQESDRLRGSFFTHHLVAGLRGAADSNGDRRVTLDEAYHYAFDQTLHQTESTRSGPQHPNYDMRLSGSGGLVLTDLRGTNALLVFAAGVKGQLYVRDDEGHLVAEIRKRGSKPLSLGLEPGAYRIRLSTGKIALSGSFTVSAAEPTVVSRRALRQESTHLATSKGPSPRWQPRHLLSASYVGTAGKTTGEQFTEPAYTPALPWRYTGELAQRASHGGELRYLHRVGPVYLGATGGFAQSRHEYTDVDGLYQPAIPVRMSESAESLTAYGLFSAQWYPPLGRWLPSALWRWIRPVVAADVGGGYIRQDKKTTVWSPPDDRQRDARVSKRELPALHARARLGLSFTVQRNIYVDLFGHAGIEVSRRLIDDLDQRVDEVDTAAHALPALGLTAGLTLAL